MTCHRAARGSVLAAAFLLGLTAVANGQDSSKPPFGEGTHALRAILNRLKMEPIGSLQQFKNEVLSGNESQILVIVLGKTSVLDDVPEGGVAGFLRKGGAILVATDRFDGSWQEAALGKDTSVSGSFVKTTPQSRSAYRESEDCPFVRPLPNKQVPVFNGLEQVATNRPSFLHIGSACPLDSLAIFPRDCRIENTPIGLIWPLRFAAGGTVGDGRMLMLADHSVFINDMMLQTDNDNFDMACKAIDWLSEEGKRKRVLFVEDGAVVTNFNLILRPPPLPPIDIPPEPELIGSLNQLLVGLEREDYFNKGLSSWISAAPDEREKKRAVRTFLMLALVLLTTLGLLVLGGLRLSRARHRIETRLPLHAPDLWQASGTRTSQREQALVLAGSFWEPARALARQFFESVAGLRPESWATSGQHLLRVTSTGGYRGPGLEKQAHELWRLAVSATPFRVVAIDFQQLLVRLPALHADLAAGALRITVE
jgi:hypothetical protein